MNEDGGTNCNRFFETLGNMRDRCSIIHECFIPKKVSDFLFLAFNELDENSDTNLHEGVKKRF